MKFLNESFDLLDHENKNTNNNLNNKDIDFCKKILETPDMILFFQFLKINLKFDFIIS